MNEEYSTLTIRGRLLNELNFITLTEAWQFHLGKEWEQDRGNIFSLLRSTIPNRSSQTIREGGAESHG